MADTAAAISSVGEKRKRDETEKQRQQPPPQEDDPVKLRAELQEARREAKRFKRDLDVAEAAKAQTDALTLMYIASTVEQLKRRVAKIEEERALEKKQAEERRTKTIRELGQPQIVRGADGHPWVLTPAVEDKGLAKKGKHPRQIAPFEYTPPVEMPLVSAEEHLKQLWYAKAQSLLPKEGPGKPLIDGSNPPGSERVNQIKKAMEDVKGKVVPMCVRGGVPLGVIGALADGPRETGVIEGV